VNQRGEDLTGDRGTPRKRTHDRRSGRYVKDFSNNNVGEFPTTIEQTNPEWTSSAPADASGTAEGWGDAPPATSEQPVEDPADPWDTINSNTTQATPTLTESSNPPYQKKPVEITKGLDEYFIDQKKKSDELAALLASKEIAAPSPRTVDKDETGGRYVEVKKTRRRSSQKERGI